MQIKCYNGEMADRREVRRIKGQFYKHKDLVKFDGKYFRCTNQQIIRLRETGKLYHRSILPSELQRLPEGVKVIKAGGKILYERHLLRQEAIALDKLFYMNEGTMFSAFVSEEEIESIGRIIKLTYSEEGESFYVDDPSLDKTTRDYLKKQAAKNQGKLYNNLQYNMNKHNRIFKNHKYTPKADLKLDRLLEGLTIGAEFETTTGKVPSRKLLELGIAPLRDGSIKGFEYTTVPMKSINHLKDIIDLLSKHCTVSFHDSLHFHVGNIPSTKEFLEKAFVISSIVQEELYEMVPEYKMNDTHHIKRRGDNYTNPLPQYRRFLSPGNRIINFLADGKDTSGSLTKRAHPSDPSGEHKWNIRNRYTCINFVPFIFGQGARTIEFRLHQGTVNEYKAIYWLLISLAIIKKAMTGEYSEIRKRTIKIADMLTEVYPKNIADALISYMEERKEYFRNYDTEDVYYEQESRDDKKYEPPIKLW